MNKTVKEWADLADRLGKEAEKSDEKMNILFPIIDKIESNLENRRYEDRVNIHLDEEVLAIIQKVENDG